MVVLTMAMDRSAKRGAPVKPPVDSAAFGELCRAR
jgi:hypothetical protein